jgi:hypothetical protein
VLGKKLRWVTKNADCTVVERGLKNVSKESLQQKPWKEEKKQMYSKFA